MFRSIPVLIAVALVAASCSSEQDMAQQYDTPEAAVVAWFSAIDEADAATATAAVGEDSLALILSIENDSSLDDTARYIDEGVPGAMQAAYWSSFGDGFAEFASRPVSTLIVGQATSFTAEGATFASIPVSSGPAAESVVFARQNEEGSWEVDLVATLGDGFVNLLQTLYDELPAGTSADVVRAAYTTTVVPALWAAMADGRYGDGFARAALSLIDAVEANQ